MIRCLIVDDELPAREEIKFILSKSNKVDIVGEAKHGMEAMELNKKYKPNLMIVDIQMPLMNGINVAKAIIDSGDNIPKFIFVTAYDKFAIQAFEVNAVDYLLKPVSEERLINRIEEIYTKNEKQEILTIENLHNLIHDMTPIKHSRLSVYHNNRLIPIDMKDIIYATIENKSTTIITKTGKYGSNYTLNELQNKLEGDSFFRCHKSFILNLNWIESIEPWFNSTYNINLKGINDIVPVSRYYSKSFKEIMNID